MKDEKKWKNREYSLRTKKHWAKGKAKDFYTRILRLVRQIRREAL